MSRPLAVRRPRWSTLALAAGATLTVHLLMPALALAARDPETTPLDLGDGADPGPAEVGGGSFARVIAGLFVVIAVIYGVTWLLKRMKRMTSGDPGRGALEAVSSMPLTGGGTLHLVRVGDEVLLVGAGGQGPATTLRGWELDEAIALGLVPDPAALPVPDDDEPPAGPGARRRPPAGPSSPAADAVRRVLDRLRAWTVRG